MKTLSPSLAVLVLCLALPAAHAEEHAAMHDHAPAKDSRLALPLTADERAIILEEMRAFLSGVQGMTGALAKKDMQASADYARGMGQKMVHEVPPALRAKLPMEFKQLGFAVHSEFDQMAADAEGLKDASHTLGQLSAALQKCVACHGAYQIREQASPNHND